MVSPVQGLMPGRLMRFVPSARVSFCLPSVSPGIPAPCLLVSQMNEGRKPYCREIGTASCNLRQAPHLHPCSPTNGRTGDNLCLLGWRWRHTKALRPLWASGVFEEAQITSVSSFPSSYTQNSIEIANLRTGHRNTFCPDYFAFTRVETQYLTTEVHFQLDFSANSGCTPHFYWNF